MKEIILAKILKVDGGQNEFLNSTWVWIGAGLFKVLN
jgi:hypothetical protein